MQDSDVHGHTDTADYSMTTGTPMHGRSAYALAAVNESNAYLLATTFHQEEMTGGNADGAATSSKGLEYDTASSEMTYDRAIRIMAEYDMLVGEGDESEESQDEDENALPDDVEGVYNNAGCFGPLNYDVESTATADDSDGDVENFYPMAGTEEHPDEDDGADSLDDDDLELLHLDMATWSSFKAKSPVSVGEASSVVKPTTVSTAISVTAEPPARPISPGRAVTDAHFQELSDRPLTKKSTTRRVLKALSKANTKRRATQREAKARRLKLEAQAREASAFLLSLSAPVQNVQVDNHTISGLENIAE